MNELTENERHLLLKDAQKNTKPPLINLVRTHNPTSYLSQHPQTGTSLGKLDQMGRSLDEYVRLMMANSEKPRARDGSYLEMLVAAWTYNNNFLTKDRKTKRTPAEAHLGLWRASNLTAWNHSVKEAPTLGKESTLGKMQEMLQMAYERKKVEDNIMDAANREKRKQLKERGTILEDEEAAELFPIFTVVVLKTDLTRIKTDKRP